MFRSNPHCSSQLCVVDVRIALDASPVSQTVGSLNITNRSGKSIVFSLIGERTGVEIDLSQPHSCLDASSAPFTMFLYFSQFAVACPRMPQSVPAMTFSLPTTWA